MKIHSGRASFDFQRFGFESHAADAARAELAVPREFLASTRSTIIWNVLLVYRVRLIDTRLTALDGDRCFYRRLCRRQHRRIGVDRIEFGWHYDHRAHRDRRHEDSGQSQCSARCRMVVAVHAATLKPFTRTWWIKVIAHRFAPYTAIAALRRWQSICPRRPESETQHRVRSSTRPATHRLCR
jgi:hypothetical protein